MRTAIIAAAGLALAACAPVTKKETTPVVATGQEVNITEGKPVDLGGGVRVDVTNVGYMHMDGSRNFSTASLLVTKGAETTELSMGRDHGEGSHEPKPATAFGWTFILVHANPYQQPSSVQVIATPPSR